MAKALDKVLPLRQIHTLDEAGQARDALLKAGGVERAGGGVGVGVRGIRGVVEPCDWHTGSFCHLSRSHAVVRVSVRIC